VPTDAGGTATVATKFDAAGNVIYTSERNAANPLTLPAEIALDRTTGAVVVAGLTYEGSSRSSFAWKLDAGGVEQWDRQWTGSLSSSYTQARGVTIDGSGNVLIAGTFSGSVDFNPSPTSAFNLTSRTCRDRPGGALYCQSGYSADAYVLKLGADGAFAWAVAMGGGARGDDAANDIATDADGNVYTTGRFHDKADFDPSSGRFEMTAKGVSSGDWLSDEAGVSDAFLSKLDAAGKFVWAAAVGGSDSTSTGDSGNGIAVGDDQSIHGTGFFRGSGDFDPTAGVRTLTSAGHGDLFVVSLTQPAAAATVAGGAFASGRFGAGGTTMRIIAGATREELRRQLLDDFEALLR
jgi:hypothetical protein